MIPFQMRSRRVKKSKIFVDIINGSPLMDNAKDCLRLSNASTFSLGCNVVRARRKCARFWRLYLASFFRHLASHRIRVRLREWPRNHCGVAQLSPCPLCSKVREPNLKCPFLLPPLLFISIQTAWDHTGTSARTQMKFCDCPSCPFS